MNRENCIIVGSGPAEEMPPAGLYSCGSPLVLCADGGLSRALAAGLKPDALIGDCDSVSVDPPPGIERVLLPEEKDVTDLRACVDYGFERGARSFILLCCTGGRLDHFYANTALLEYILGKGGEGLIADRYNEIRLHAPGRLELPPDDRFPYISLLPYDREVTGVTTEGLYYPLTNALLSRAHSLGVSNRRTDENTPAAVTTTGGLLLVVKSRDIF